MKDYKLTLLQFGASRFLISNFQNKTSGVIVAVCGSGKTEMCFPLIERELEFSKIGFAIPRIDICEEIYARLCSEFGFEHIGLITGSKKINPKANVLVLTTNQLIKYYNYFNLVIIDEVDAFPFDVEPRFYSGVLSTVSNGCLFYLTSTPSKRLISMNLNTYTIYKRWHNLPLPIPKLIYFSSPTKFPVRLLLLLKKPKRNILLFVSTISFGEQISLVLNKYKISHKFVYSSAINRTADIEWFKTGTDKILLSTTILERGITFDDIDLIIIDTHNSFYNKAALVQIAGRARRKIDYQEGNVYFGYNYMTTTIKEAITFIKENNNKI